MALIELDTLDHAVDCLIELDNASYNGRNFRVQYSKSKINMPPLKERDISVNSELVEEN